MPITPTGVNCIFRFVYTAAGIEHNANYWCDFAETPVPGTNPVIAAFTGEGDNNLATEIAGFYKVLWDDFFRSTDTLEKYQVFKITTEGKDLIYEAGIAQAGAADTGVQDKCGQLTLSYRTNTGKKVRAMFLGFTNFSRGKANTTTGALWDSFSDDMLNKSGGHLGDFFGGRDGSYLASLVNVSEQVNNRLERKTVWGT